MGGFKQPHAGELKDLYVEPTAAEAEKQAARDYAPWDLTTRQLCEIWAPDTKAEAKGVCGSTDAEHAPRRDQGFTVFFAGLSGSGKSTTANALMSKLTEIGDWQISLLDCDIVRKNLSSELGFSEEYRDLNTHRVGFVASEIKQLTDTSDAYETPEKADLVIDSVNISPGPAAHRILVKLESMGSIQ